MLAPNRGCFQRPGDRIRRESRDLRAVVVFAGCSRFPQGGQPWGCEMTPWLAYPGDRAMEKTRVAAPSRFRPLSFEAQRS